MPRFETDSQRAEFEVAREKKAGKKEFTQQVTEQEAGKQVMLSMAKKMEKLEKGTARVIAKANAYVDT